MRVRGRDFLQGFCDGVVQSAAAPGFCAAQERFDFAPHFLDGVEIGRVGGQEPGLASGLFNQLEYPLLLVAGEVVHHNDVARLERWKENAFDVDSKDVSVRGGLDGHARCCPVQSDRADHRRRAPVPGGGAVVNPQSLRRPAPQACHVGLGCRFIQENQVAGVALAELALPGVSGGGDFRAALLAGAERLFLYVMSMSTNA